MAETELSPNRELKIPVYDAIALNPSIDSLTPFSKTSP